MWGDKKIKLFMILCLISFLLIGCDKMNEELIKDYEKKEVVMWEDDSSVYYGKEKGNADLIFVKGSGNVGIGYLSREELEKDKKRDSRINKEFVDNEGTLWTYLNIFFEERQPITIWENNETKERVEMLGYYAPSGRLQLNTNHEEKVGIANDNENSIIVDIGNGSIWEDDPTSPKEQLEINNNSTQHIFWETINETPEAIFTMGTNFDNQPFIRIDCDWLLNKSNFNWSNINISFIKGNKSKQIDTRDVCNKLLG